MMAGIEKISNWLLSILAGGAAFVFTLAGFVMLTGIDQQVAFSLLMGLFALLVVRAAAERPTREQAQAVAALVDRLLAVGRGDLASPAPPVLRARMPGLAAAVDGLFAQVRSSLDNFQTMAMYDPVTSLPNRVHFRREAERILTARQPSDRTALLFVDLDGFKEVNDRLGHAQGDQVLVMVANRLRVVLKAETEAGTLTPPLLARLAGDEFTLLLPNVGGPEEAERIAGRALEALSQPFRNAGQSTYMGASIGVALCPTHGADLTTLMKAADIAMYHAKGSGRSRVCLYNAALAKASEERSGTERALRSALERNELGLVFEPQICLRTGSALGAEALVKWRREGRKPQLLDRSIEVPEDSGLVLEIGDWSLGAVGEALAGWDPLSNLRISLPVRPRQLDCRDFFARLGESLDRFGGGPWPLELLLTKGAVLRCDEQQVADLFRLRARGVTVALDDFGAGASSLARIRQLPVGRVRLGLSLVADIDASETSRTIVSALIHLIHGLGCQAVAKGIERPEQLEVLRAVGCDVVQGPLCGQPMGEAEFGRWSAALTQPRRLARAS
jgi:diguanylate cyclase (GGDEF)-like protein